MKTIRIENVSSDGLKDIAEIYIREIYSLKDLIAKTNDAGMKEILEDELVGLEKEYYRLRDYMDR